MNDVISRVLDNLIARGTGPLRLRLLLQPTIAAILAIRDGIKDAKAGRAPYLWSIFRRPRERGGLIHGGWRSVARVFALAIVVDVVFQLIVFRWIYPGEALAIAALLALVPYALLRGPSNRLTRLFLSSRVTRHSRDG